MSIERPLPYIDAFLTKNKSLLELIAVFVAIATFIIDLNKDSVDLSLTIGTMFLILFIGLLLGYLIFITILEDLNPILFRNSDSEIHSTIQLFFISLFDICLIVAYFTIFSFFASHHPILAGWMIIFLFTVVLVCFGLWFVSALFAHFSKDKKTIGIIKGLFIIMSVALIIFIIPIRDFLLETFSSTGQSEIIFCIIWSFFLYGATFYFRK